MRWEKIRNVHKENEAPRWTVGWGIPGRAQISLRDALPDIPAPIHMKFEERVNLGRGAG